MPDSAPTRSGAPLTRDHLDRLIKAYDVRGVVPDDLGPDIARLVGAAFVTVVGAARTAGGPGSVVMGHDMRPSGPELVAAFAEGATSQGVDLDRGRPATELVARLLGLEVSA